MAIADRALELGINYIDTAAGYGNGVSERHIGLILNRRRSGIWLSSKTAGRTYDGSMRLLERSLANLQSDYMDTRQLHNLQRLEEFDRIFAKDGAIQAFVKARDQGIVCCLGVTGHFERNNVIQALERFPFDTILM
jgi:predicted aldo/keto reductase-like oxidoreductase